MIIDDMVDTAGTLTFAAQMIKDRGAKSINAFATHAVLSGPALERIENSPIEKLVVTDSIPIAKISPKIEVVSVAKLFADTIDSVYHNESISMGFVF